MNENDLKYYEVGQLHCATSALHWNAIVRQILRVRDGVTPPDWDRRIEASGFRAEVEARWAHNARLRSAQAEGAINAAQEGSAP